MKTRSTALVLGLALSLPWATARADDAHPAASAYKKVEPVLTTSRTVIDEALVLADKSPLAITSTIVTIDPGEETAWHKHGVPLYVYILSGEVTVDYGDKGTRAFGPGNAFMEAMDHWHRGTNRGKEPVRILTVYMGSDKAANVIPKP